MNNNNNNNTNKSAVFTITDAIFVPLSIIKEENKFKHPTDITIHNTSAGFFVVQNDSKKSLAQNCREALLIHKNEETVQMPPAHQEFILRQVTDEIAPHPSTLPSYSPPFPAPTCSVGDIDRDGENLTIIDEKDDDDGGKSSEEEKACDEASGDNRLVNLLEQSKPENEEVGDNSDESFEYDNDLSQQVRYW